MSLLRRFDDDLKQALKAAERSKVSVIRMVKAAVKNAQIEKGRELTDEEIISVLFAMAKQRRESIEQFTRGSRADLVRNEEQELGILQSYMPQQLGNDEIERMIHDAIRESSAAGAQDMGKVMRILMPRIKGLADGKYVNQRVKEL
ncbi:MAG: glutamyl-tRNA(Gln) amidotransferase subunit, partial [Deltaproteobacteria bacterium]|nr:glutamyl-tRNA(Gln) amidotransferase subunit [Deltaproteobacteria bacterium]